MHNKNNLFIAITGNRDISQKQRLYVKNELLNILEKLQKTEEKIKIITPLADGVDRLIVEVVLENKQFSTFDFLVPLPMDEDIYLDTFGKGLKINPITQKESIEEYNHLISRMQSLSSKKSIKENLTFDRDLYFSSNADEQRAIRRTQYERLGEYLMENADILIAVYDKNRELKQGGTLEIVSKFNRLNPHGKTLYEIEI